jgi:magnesium transporter
MEREGILKLLDERKFIQVRRIIQEQNAVDFAEFIEEIEEDPRALLLFRLLPKEMAAEVFSYLDHDIQQRIVEGITDKELAGIIDELFLDDTVDFIDEMPASIVKRVIKMASSDIRGHINQLLMYPDESAGSIMTIEFMEIDSDWRVGRALRAIRQQSEDKESISTLFVTDEQRHLQGIVGLRSILVAEDSVLVGDLMKTDVLSVSTHDDQAEVARIFQKYDLLSIPVVDQENRLVGIITIDDIVDVMEEETTEDIYKMAAMQPIQEGYMDTGVLTLARKRIGWLMVLMVSATFTGMIIQNYNSALAANVLLASFIPMLMDTSGNAGSQASVSIIRGLVLGEVELKNIFTVIWKEFRVSLVVGGVIALFNYFRILLLQHDAAVAAVVAITIFCAVVASKIVGCTLPLIATRLKLDPALMASPMITTIVDAIALLVYFNVASVLLPELR